MKPSAGQPEYHKPDEIFDAARNLRADERGIYLDRACGDNTVLRQRVEALLLAHEAASGKFLPEQPAVVAPGRMAPGRLLGDYEILGEIGRGGMGIVYRARQLSLNRRVALKMILAGPLANPASVQRFHTEAEAAARLHHPHIVPIFEIGEHENEHYFSMELIEGKTLAQLLAEEVKEANKPEPTKTAWRTHQIHSANLLAKVAAAVHYAHQCGVLHRDLKPTNILIDASGEPHVTDFGLAKLMEAEEKASKSSTTFGTPTYMAPEQASGRQKPLTTAADTYSLGAILYESLTGRPPFRAETPLETLRQVCEQEPVHPRALNPLVDRDLETICLKCLNKDPQRRYDSALALAEDLNRWRKGEPIQARSVRTTERIWLWARRKPAIGALSAVAIFLLLSGAVVSTWQAVRATRAKQLFLFEAVGNDKVVAFLRGILEALPRSLAEGRDTSEFEKIVDQAVARMDKEVPTHHRAEANLRNIIGGIYSELGNHPKAEVMFRKALATERQLHGPSHPHVAGCARPLAKSLVDQGKMAEAEVVLREGMTIRQEAFGDEPTEFEEMQSILGAVRISQGRFSEAETLFKTILETRRKRLGENDSLVLSSMNNLSVVLLNQGKLSEAEATQRRVLELRRGLPSSHEREVAQSLHNLSGILNVEGKFAEAGERMREALELRKKSLGNDHPETLESRLALGAILTNQRRWEEAASTLQEALATQKKLARENLSTADILDALGRVREQQNRLSESEELRMQALALRTTLLGETNPAVAQSLSSLAHIKRKQGRLTEAMELQQRALMIRREILGPEHLHTAASLHNLAVILRDQRHFPQADSLFTNALAIRTKLLGPEHPDLAATLSEYAASLQEQNRLTEAEPLTLQAYAMRIKLLGPEDNETIETLDNLAHLRKKQQRLPEAEARFREVVAAREKAFGADHPGVALGLDRLACVQWDQGKKDEAESTFEKALPAFRKLLNAGDTNALVPLRGYAWAILLGNGKPDQAEALLEEILTTVKRTRGDRDPVVAERLTNLAEWYVERGKLDRAEPLFIESNELVQQSPLTTTKEKRGAIERLWKFYVDWAVAAPGTGKMDQASEWRKRLTEFDEISNSRNSESR